MHCHGRDRASDDVRGRANRFHRRRSRAESVRCSTKTVRRSISTAASIFNRRTITFAPAGTRSTHEWAEAAQSTASNSLSRSFATCLKTGRSPINRATDCPIRHCRQFPRRDQPPFRAGWRSRRLAFSSLPMNAFDGRFELFRQGIEIVDDLTSTVKPLASNIRKKDRHRTSDFRILTHVMQPETHEREFPVLGGGRIRSWYRRRYLDLLGSIYIYNEHRGYTAIDRVLEAVRARWPDDHALIARDREAPRGRAQALSDVPPLVRAARRHAARGRPHLRPHRPLRRDHVPARRSTTSTRCRSSAATTCSSACAGSSR